MNNLQQTEQVAEGNGAHFKHTPGPWKVVLSDEIYDKSGTIIADCSYRDDIFTKDGCQANAERIVACVNAMEGIEDPHTLRETWDAIQHLELDAYQKMKEQRDELLNALEMAHDFMTGFYGHDQKDDEKINMIRSVILNARVNKNGN